MAFWRAEIEAVYAPAGKGVVEKHRRCIGGSLGFKLQRIKFVVFIWISHIISGSRRQQKYITGLQDKFAAFGGHEQMSGFADLQLAVGVVLKMPFAGIKGQFSPRSTPI